MPSENVQKWIFIGLPGPTHHYGGLSADNVASGRNQGLISNPREAALQALELARLLRGLDVEVAFLPPHKRPHMGLLHQHFTGDDAQVLEQAARQGRRLLEKASSSSAMWTANAATIAPAMDTMDGQLHISTANLFSNLHRRIEAEETHATLQAIFASVPGASVHAPLSAAAGLLDEGAANHMRLSPSHADTALHVFVYGTAGKPHDPETARQALSASQAIAQQHRLPEAQRLFLLQNPEAIRAGVFHNDVIAVSNENVLLAHSRAFAGGREDMASIAQAYEALYPGRKLHTLVVGDEQLSLNEAVSTYFFNSQIVTRPGGGMTVLAPGELQSLYDGKAARLMESLCAGDCPIDEVRYVNLRQSMRNGGGPACLRLRVVMTPAQLAALRKDVRVLADDILLGALERVIRKRYPETLSGEELGDGAQAQRAFDAIAECRQLMRLPPI